MRSTGEVLGMSKSYGEAFFKAQEAIQSTLPTEGTVLISVNRKDKAEIVDVARIFEKCGFKLVATAGTCDVLREAGIHAERVLKINEGRPHLADLITNGEISLVINSPVGQDSVVDDSYLRKAAIKARVPYITTIAAAKAAADGIRYIKTHATGEIRSLQAYHAMIH